MAEVTKNSVIHAEDLQKALDAVEQYTVQRAAQLRAKNPARSYATGSKTPDIGHLLTDRLRAALEDEVVAATSTPSDSESILKWELDRELAKKALVGLRLPELRGIAAGRGLATLGDAEKLATSIATAYRWDEQEIARLVLEHEPEPRPERGHVTRIFALTKRPDMAQVQARLGYVIDRYVRVGVARWFIFESVEASLGDDDSVALIEIRGRLRSYRAAVDDRAEEPQLSAQPDYDSEVVLRLDARQPIVEIAGVSAPVARNALKALEFVCKLDGVKRAPYATRPPGSLAAALAPEAAMLLDLLYTRLPKAGVRDRNLTVARFRVSKDSEAESLEAAERPRLRAVRFEGDHLLDSVAACGLLTTGRALVDWSAIVRVEQADSADELRFPVRVALERDHGLVMTGFGSTGFEKSGLLHRILRETMIQELTEGIADFAALDRLVARMQRLADSGADSQTPAMLEDDEVES